MQAGWNVSGYARRQTFEVGKSGTDVSIRPSRGVNQLIGLVAREAASSTRTFRVYLNDRLVTLSSKSVAAR